MWAALKYQIVDLPKHMEPEWVQNWRTATYNSVVMAELDGVLNKVPYFSHSIVETFPLMCLVRSKEIPLEDNLGIVAGYGSINEKTALLIRSGGTDKDEVIVLDPEKAELVEIWAHMPSERVSKVLSDKIRGKA